MYLVYVDEYGTSGGHLDNPAEPFFSLTACIVEEKQWNKLEADILKLQRRAIDELTRLGNPPLGRFEFHAAEMLQGKKLFKGMPIESQLYYAEELLKLAVNNGVRYISCGVPKRELHAVMMRLLMVDATPEVPGLANANTVLRARMSPYSIAFCSLLAVLNIWLTEQIERGVLIFDEHSEYGRLATLGSYSHARLDNSLMSNILAAPFFSDSKVHLPLQIADLVGYLVGRENVAAQRGQPVKPPIIEKWLDTYFVPFDVAKTTNIPGTETSDLSVAIVQEMWPFETASAPLRQYCEVVTRHFFDAGTIEGYEVNRSGDETL